MIKTCPICKKEFETHKGNHKFCSQECRLQGEYARHREWIRRTNYNEKKRVEMRQRRQKEADDHREHLKQMYDERLKQIQEDKERQENELQSRADAGDHEALMIIAKRSGDMLTYYRQFALYDIEREAKDFGRKSTREINGISVYDPDFAENVLRSIKETGRCINKTNGLGEKLEA